MSADFRIGSNDNTLFTTARCDNRCLMCCQPPGVRDDIEELWQHNLEILRRAPQGIKVVGISGGEPTLLGDRLIELIKHIRATMPEADIHLLTNGRNFRHIDLCRRVAEAARGRLVAGIPLHSDYCGDHDRIAGASEAYCQTMAGLYNLAAFGVPIELRIVINRLNYRRLPHMAEFIHKNLPFVAWTAFMAMEHTGLAVAHEQEVWIEPTDYAPRLEEAVLTLAQWRRHVSIYNVPLCLLPPSLRPYAEQSISDWKTRFEPLCEPCLLKSECCGLFSTSRRTFRGLTPKTAEL